MQHDADEVKRTRRSRVTCRCIAARFDETCFGIGTIPVRHAVGVQSERTLLRSRRPRLRCEQRLLVVIRQLQRILGLIAMLVLLQAARIDGLLRWNQQQ